MKPNLRLVYSRPKVMPVAVTIATAGLGMVLWCTLVVGVFTLSLLNALPERK